MNGNKGWLDLNVLRGRHQISGRIEFVSSNKTSFGVTFKRSANGEITLQPLSEGHQGNSDTFRFPSEIGMKGGALIVRAVARYMSFDRPTLEIEIRDKGIKVVGQNKYAVEFSSVRRP